MVDLFCILFLTLSYSAYVQVIRIKLTTIKMHRCIFCGELEYTSQCKKIFRIQYSFTWEGGDCISLFQKCLHPKKDISDAYIQNLFS